jgi:hypothetical protein
MKTTISINDFRDAYQKLGANNFSYEGLTWIYEYLEKHEFLFNKEIESDVIDCCCEFTEYTYEQVIKLYSLKLDNFLSLESRNKFIRDFINDEAGDCVVVGFDNDKFLVQDF